MVYSKYTKDINKLINWADKKGYDIDFHSSYDDELNFDTKLITINAKSTPEIQIYSLLHECGHLLLSGNKTRYDQTYPSNNSRTKYKSQYKIKGHIVDTLAEEIDAWRQGKKLAKRLNIKINETNYNKETWKWVFSHLEYLYKEYKG